jgi:PAS domain S-box-containing protein
MFDDSLKELQKQMMLAIDNVETNFCSSDELQLLLLRVDHTLRSQLQKQEKLKDSLRLMTTELHGRLNQLAHIRDLGYVLDNLNSCDSLFDRLPKFLRTVFKAEACSLMLIDPASNRLEHVGADLAESNPDQVSANESNSVSFIVGEGIAGWVAANSTSRLSIDVCKDPLYNDYSNDRRGGSLLCAPLIIDSQVFGVINLSHSNTSAFDRDDEYLLNLLCDPVSIALGRARLSESFNRRVTEQTHELEEVRDFFQSIVNSSDDLIVVLGPEMDVILVSRVLDTMTGYEVNEMLSQRINKIISTEGAQELENALAGGLLVRDHDIQLIHKNGNEIHASVNASAIRGANREILGYLCIFRSIERRMRIHRELTRLNHRLNALFEASIQISSSLDVQQVLDRVLHTILQLLDANEGQLLLLTPDGRALKRWQPTDSDKVVDETPVALSDCPEGIVVKQHKPLLLPDSTAIRQFLPDESHRLCSSLMVPLKVQEKVLGVLRVDSLSNNRLFDYQDLRLITTFATQAALAIENSRLFSSTRRETSRLRGLLDLSRDTAQTHSVDGILQLYAKQVLQLSGAKAAISWEYRSEENQLRLVELMENGITLGKVANFIDLDLPEGDPYHKLTADFEHRLKYCPLPDNLPKWIPGAEENQISLLVLPVSNENELYGLLMLYWDERSQLMEEDEHFIEVLAMQAAHAIHVEKLMSENLSGNRFLTSIVDSATDAIIVTDRRGCITLFNPGAEVMLDLKAEKMLGQRTPELFPEADRIFVKMRKLMNSSSTSMSFETVLFGRNDRQVPVQLSLSWLKNFEGRITGLLGVAKDISEMKTLESNRLETERLKGIERIAVTVSDKVNTPLSIILAHIDMIKILNEDLDENSSKSLGVVEDQVNRIRLILDQIDSFKNAPIKKYGLVDVDMYDIDSWNAEDSNHKLTGDGNLDSDMVEKPVVELISKSLTQGTEIKKRPVARNRRRTIGKRTTAGIKNNE